MRIHCGGCATEYDAKRGQEIFKAPHSQPICEEYPRLKKRCLGLSVLGERLFFSAAGSTADDFLLAPFESDFSVEFKTELNEAASYRRSGSEITVCKQNPPASASDCSFGNAHDIIFHHFNYIKERSAKWYFAGAAVGHFNISDREFCSKRFDECGLGVVKFF
jgi:hypothetical protein